MPLRQAVADVLALSDERDTWMLRIREAWRAAFELGYALGRSAGRAEAETEQARSWRAMASPVAAGGTAYTELDRRRWVLRGEQRTRDTFGTPHEADYRGQGGGAA